MQPVPKQTEEGRVIAHSQKNKEIIRILRDNKMNIHRKLILGLSLITLMSVDAWAENLLPQEICLQSTNSYDQQDFNAIWYLHFSAIEGHKHLFTVNGFEFGEKSSPIETYVDGMDGTAIIATESHMLNAKETLHISLQGSGSDLKKDIHDMWHTDAIFDLNPATFEGSLMSFTTDNIIALGLNSKVPVKYTSTRNILIKKVSCPNRVMDILDKTDTSSQ